MKRTVHSQHVTQTEDLNDYSNLWRALFGAVSLVVSLAIVGGMLAYGDYEVTDLVMTLPGSLMLFGVYLFVSAFVREDRRTKKFERDYEEARKKRFNQTQLRFF